MSTPERAIAILTCMSRFYGTRSSGTATVKSTGATGRLPKGVYAFPIVGKQIDFTRPFRSAYVDAQGLASGADVVLAGTSIPITSCLGGAGNNLEAGTKLVWFPFNDGLDASATVDADMTGGAQAAESRLVQLKSSAWSPDPVVFTVELVRSQLTRLPGMLVSWTGRGPMNRVHGEQTYERSDRWTIYLVVDRQESHHTRAFQGLALVDAVCEELAGRQSVDGVSFSNPPTKVIGAGVHAIAENFYAYKVMIETTTTRLSTTDASRGDGPGAGSPWERTSFEFPTTEPEDGSDPDPRPDVAAFVEPQP